MKKATMTVVLCAALVGCDSASQIIQSSQVVTKEEYLGLKTGMSYEEAVAVIGAEGEELSRMDMPTMPSASTVMYAWVNSDGSNANAMFQGGKLNMKAQFGLE